MKRDEQEEMGKAQQMAGREGCGSCARASNSEMLGNPDALGSGG